MPDTPYDPLPAMRAEIDQALMLAPQMAEAWRAARVRLPIVPGCVQDHWPTTPNVIEVAATQPAAPGARPLFVRTLPMVWCKHCDGPPVTPGGSVQALALELLVRGFAVTSAY
jgi:hypothetical protein